MDGDVILWDPDRGEAVLNLRKRMVSPACVAFCQDGRWLLGLNGYRHRFLRQRSMALNSGFVVWENRLAQEQDPQSLESALEADQEATGFLSGKGPGESVVLHDTDPSNLIRLGWMRADAGDWAQAELASAKAVELGAIPGILEGEGYHLTWMRIALGDALVRQQAIRELLKRYRESSMKRQRVCWLLVMPPGLPVETYQHAVRTMTAAASAEPDKGYHWVTLSLAQMRAGRWQDCIISANRAISLSANADGAAYFALAIATSNLGRHDEARSWYEKGTTWIIQNQDRYRKRQALLLDRLRLQGEAAQLLGKPAPPEVLGWKH